MFQVMTPQNAVGCVTCYAPSGAKGSAPFSGSIGPLETVRNKLRTLRGVLWVREKSVLRVCKEREKGGL